jgi:serine/threonine protein phosphatase PrpC
VTEAMGLLCAAGWLEKKPGLGEDAEPTLRLHESGRGLLGVYDGVGGSGSAAARRLRDGTELSGAYVAARLTRDLVEAWYTRSIDGHAELDDETGEALATWLRAALRDEAEFLPAARGGLRGSLHRVLPTTAAVLAFGPGGTEHEPTARADVWWAGDSRAFVLTPLGGLQVLSVDDTREHDALALIRNDQPMDNLVSADRPFALHRSSVEVSGPAVFLVATDGCYGYLRTPAHFEYLLLRMLEAATSLEEWAVGIVDTLAGFTGDDASFSLAAVGFSGLESMQGAFAERYDYLYGQHWMPFREADGDPERIEALREESWLVYRDLYHARLARDGGLDPSGPGSAGTDAAAGTAPGRDDAVAGGPGAGPSDAMAPGPDPFGDQQS